MIVMSKTLEELEELEIDLREEDESQDGYYSKLISLYEQMRKCLLPMKKNEPEEYELRFPYVKKQLVAHYIKYGTYMKVGLEKNPELAKSALQKALQFDADNPIAHYRLGFLAYQKRKYFEALQAFQNAIKNQATYQDKDFLLNEMQLYYAQLYSINSALYIAQETQKNLQNFDHHPIQLSYETSPLLALIEKNEEQLFKEAFYHVSWEGMKTCSVDYCNKLVDEIHPKDTVILYFADRTTFCSYNGKEAHLSLDRADILRHLLLACSKEKPGTRHMFRSYFNVRDELTSNTFRKKVGRLIDDIKKDCLVEFIEQTTVNNETAYYVPESVPFIVLYRVDDIVAIEMGFNV